MPSFIQAQVVVPLSESTPEQTQKQTKTVTYISSKYTKKYPAIPRFIALSTRWFSSPKDIASHISLNALNTSIQYLENNTPYLESTTKDEKKTGRLFLKIINGQLYTLYDLTFVPYIQKNQKSETADPDFIIPLQKDRNKGFSLVVDIVHKNNSGTHNSLIRYLNEEKNFEEKYQYANRGALRTLTRTYTSGVVDRFLYYFTTKGLEEVFHQEANGNAYQQKYAPNGSLTQRTEYTSDGKLSYSLEYIFDKNNILTNKEEIDFTKKQKIIEDYLKVGIVKKQTFSLETENETTKEILINSTEYDYNPIGNQIFGKSIGSLDEINTESEYNKENVLIKKRIYVNKDLKKEIEYKDDRLRIETIYLDKNPVLKVYFKGSEKIKEEVFKNNKVLETRE